MTKILGANPSEEKILLSILRSGPRTISEISRDTRLPKNKVYDILKDLVKEKLVEPQPKLYKQKSYGLNKAEFARIVETRGKELEAALKAVAQIREKVGKYTQERKPILSEEIWIGHQDDAVRQTRELLEEAKRSILICTYIFSWYDQVQDIILNKRIVCEVPTVVLMTDPASSELLEPAHRVAIANRVRVLKEIGIDVRLSNKPLPFRGSIIDGRVCLMMIFPYATEKGDFNSSIGYCVCKNSAIVGTIVGYFEMFQGHLGTTNGSSNT